MTISLSAALFYAGQRQAVSVAQVHEGMDVAATILPDPLRGDPLSPDVVRLVELIRPVGVVRCPRCETVPVLVTPEPVDRGPWGGA